MSSSMSSSSSSSPVSNTTFIVCISIFCLVVLGIGIAIAVSAASCCQDKKKQDNNNNRRKRDGNKNNRAFGENNKIGSGAKDSDKAKQLRTKAGYIASSMPAERIRANGEKINRDNLEKIKARLKSCNSTSDAPKPIGTVWYILRSLTGSAPLGDAAFQSTKSTATPALKLDASTNTVYFPRTEQPKKYLFTFYVIAHDNPKSSAQLKVPNMTPVGECSRVDNVWGYSSAISASTIASQVATPNGEVGSALVYNAIYSVPAKSESGIQIGTDGIFPTNSKGDIKMIELPETVRYQVQ
jgi:hypothetical protein